MSSFTVDSNEHESIEISCDKGSFRGSTNSEQPCTVVIDTKDEEENRDDEGSTNAYIEKEKDDGVIVIEGRKNENSLSRIEEIDSTLKKIVEEVARNSKYSEKELERTMEQIISVQNQYKSEFNHATTTVNDFPQKAKATLVEKYEEQIKKLKATSLVSSRREKRAKAALGKALSGGDLNRETECMNVFNQLDEQNQQYVIAYEKEKKRNDNAAMQIKALTEDNNKLSQELASLACKTSDKLALMTEERNKARDEASAFFKKFSDQQPDRAEMESHFKELEKGIGLSRKEESIARKECERLEEEVLSMRQKIEKSEEQRKKAEEEVQRLAREQEKNKFAKQKLKQNVSALESALNNVERSLAEKDSRREQDRPRNETVEDQSQGNQKSEDNALHRGETQVDTKTESERARYEVGYMAQECQKLKDCNQSYQHKVEELTSSLAVSEHDLTSAKEECIRLRHQVEDTIRQHGEKSEHTAFVAGEKLAIFEAEKDRATKEVNELAVKLTKEGKIRLALETKYDLLKSEYSVLEKEENLLTAECKRLRNEAKENASTYSQSAEATAFASGGKLATVQLERDQAKADLLEKDEIIATNQLELQRLESIVNDLGIIIEDLKTKEKANVHQFRQFREEKEKAEAQTQKSSKQAAEALESLSAVVEELECAKEEICKVSKEMSQVKKGSQDMRSQINDLKKEKENVERKCFLAQETAKRMQEEAAEARRQTNQDVNSTLFRAAEKVATSDAQRKNLEEKIVKLEDKLETQKKSEKQTKAGKKSKTINDECELLRAEAADLVRKHIESSTRIEKIERNYTLVENERNYALQEAAKLTGAVEQYKTKNISLQDKMRKMEKSLEEAEEEIVFMKEECKQNENKTSDTIRFHSEKSDVSALAAAEKIAVAEKEVQKLRSEITRIESSVGTYMRERTGLENTMEKLKKEAYECKEVESAVRKEWKKLQKEHDDLKIKSAEDINRTALKAAETIAGAEIKIEEGIRQKERKDEAMRQHHLMVQQLEYKYKDAKHSMEEMIVQKEAVEANCEHLREELEHVRNDNTQNLQSLAFTSGEKIASTQAKHDLAIAEIKQLQRKVLGLEDDILHYQLDIENAEKQMQQAEKEHMERFKKCEDQLSATDEKLHLTNLQHDVVTLELHKAQTLIGELENEITGLRNDLEEEKQNYSSMKEHSERALEQLMYTEQSLQDAHEDANAAHESVNKKLSEISEMDCRIQQLTMESLKISEEITFARKESTKQRIKAEEDAQNFNIKLAQTTHAAADKVASAELAKEMFEDETKREIKNMKEKFAKKEEDLLEKLSYAENEVKNSQRQLDRHSSSALSKLTALEAERNYLEDTLERNTRDLNQTHRSVVTLNEKIAEQDADVKGKNEEIQSLKSALDTAIKEENLAQKRVKQSHEDAVELRKQYAEEIQRSAYDVAEKVAAAETEKDKALNKLEKLRIECEATREELSRLHEDSTEQIKNTACEAAQKIAISETEKIAALEELRKRKEELSEKTIQLETVQKTFADETQRVACAYSEKLACAETERDTIRDDLAHRQQELKSVIGELTSTRECYNSEILNTKTWAANKIAAVEEELSQVTSDLHTRELEAQEYLDQFHSAEEAHNKEINLFMCDSEKKLAIAETERDATKCELQIRTKQYLTVSEELRLFEIQHNEKFKKSTNAAAERIACAESQIEDMHQKLQEKERKLRDTAMKMKHTNDNYEDLKKEACIAAEKFAATVAESEYVRRELEQSRQGLAVANRELEIIRGQYGDEMKLVAQTAANRVAHAEEGRDLAKKQLSNERSGCKRLKEELVELRAEYNEEFKNSALESARKFASIASSQGIEQKLIQTESERDTALEALQDRLDELDCVKAELAKCKRNLAETKRDYTEDICALRDNAHRDPAEKEAEALEEQTFYIEQLEAEVDKLNKEMEETANNLGMSRAECERIKLMYQEKSSEVNCVLFGDKPQPDLTTDMQEKLEAGEKLLKKLGEWKSLYNKNRGTPMGPLYKNMLEGWGEAVN